MGRKPRIAITMGDPAGIGPEIIAKALLHRDVTECAAPFIVGSAAVMGKLCDELGIKLSIKQISSPEEISDGTGSCHVLSADNVDLNRHAWGRPTAANGKAVVEYIKTATELALSGQADAVVTAPINKEMMNAAGYDYAGHTELLAHLTGAREYGMLFVGGGLRLILATIHNAIKDVPRLITKKRVLTTIRLAHRAMRSFGFERPRIGVAALNPHASEGGLFGHEELNDILPAVLEARAEGIDASDPLPADTLFHKAKNGSYDIVVAMYHDQGLAPLKVLAFGSAVNVTVGLPIIRTSVDHGTAYDISGKGCADPQSLIEAVKLAARLVEYRTSGMEVTR